MTIGLKIIWGRDSTIQTLDLNDGTTVVATEYAPHGGKPNQATVTETVELLCRDVAAGRTLVNQINRLIGREGQAIQWARRQIYQPVCIWLCPQLGVDAWYRAWIVPESPEGDSCGVAEWEEDILRSWRLQGGVGSIRLTFTRLAWWELITVWGIPVSNHNGSNVGGGLLVENQHDLLGATAQNWVQIAADVTVGDLNAPGNLYMYPQGGTDASRLYAWTNVYSDPTGAPPQVVQGEDLVADDATITPTVDATSSLGHYAAVAWNDAAEVHAGHWVIYGGMVASALNNFFRCLARFTAATTGLKLRLGLSNDLGYQWRGPQMYFEDGHALQVLGDLQLAPNMPFAPGDRRNINLDLYCQINSAGAHSFGLDYVYLACLDGWRYYRNGPGIGAYCLIDEAGADRLYIADPIGPGHAPPYLPALGSPIPIVPGRVQRIYFAWEESDGTAPIDKQLKIGVTYYPRRDTL